MDFTSMRDKLISHFNEMVKGADQLFEVDLDKDELWNLYLNSFVDGTNEMFRERREHDCSCCRQFIRNIGNVVVIKDNTVDTIWNFKSDDEYQPVLDALDRFVRSKVVNNVYVSKQIRVGTKENLELLENGKTLKWDHFYLDLPDRLVDKTTKSAGEIKGMFKGCRDVFKRSLDEIDKDSILTVLELINSNSLYRGEEWASILTTFLSYLTDYEKIDGYNLEERDIKRENFAWEMTGKANTSVAKIRNHSIGTLLINISAGMDLNEAVGRYEAIVAPNNYKRPKAIFTKKMLDSARKTIEDLGYMSALGRRFATLDDITANNILFLNRDTEAMTRVGMAEDIFGELEKKVTSAPKKFDRVEEVAAERFVRDILPGARELEVYLENKHSGHMVSLIAPKDKTSKTMFKWNNNFSWAYAGNVTDSLKERVKAAGGKVDGDLRFSIQWNDGAEYNGNDFDAHCLEPSGYEIYYPNARQYSPSRGMLDIDVIRPDQGSIAVENIIYGNREKMEDGVYTFLVNCYTNRGGADGFRAEIEFDEQIYSFEYPHSVQTGKNVEVANVTLKNGVFTIKPTLSTSAANRELWNLATNKFIPASVVMYSPNYWDEQTGNGNRHYFFMLQGCKNGDRPNGFYNEFLKNELAEHKRVFEALGSQMRVEPADDQLSGLGFSSTKRDELIVKVKGNTERILKVKF